MEVTREFITALRREFISGLEERGYPVDPEIVSAFTDAALTVTLGGNSTTPPPADAAPELSRGQKAARTRARNQARARRKQSNTVTATATDGTHTSTGIDPFRAPAPLPGGAK